MVIKSGQIFPEFYLILFYLYRLVWNAKSYLLLWKQNVFWTNKKKLLQLGKNKRSIMLEKLHT